MILTRSQSNNHHPPHSGAGFFYALHDVQRWAVMSLYSPASSRRLCGLLWPPGGIFAPASSGAWERPKRKTAVKAIHRPVTAFYTIVAIPIFPHRQTAYRGPQTAKQGIKQPRPAPSGVSRGILLYGCLQRVNLRPECCNPCADRVHPPLLHDPPDCFTVCIFPAVAVCRLCRSLAAGRHHQRTSP